MHNKEMLVSCPVMADDNIPPSTGERTLIWMGDLLANPLEMSTGQISVQIQPVMFFPTARNHFCVVVRWVVMESNPEANALSIT